MCRSDLVDLELEFIALTYKSCSLCACDALSHAANIIILLKK